MKSSRMQMALLLFISCSLPAYKAHGQNPPDAARKIALTIVESKPETITRQYSCRINSHRHIEVRAPEDGYLQEIFVKEGQAVKKGDLIFGFLPVLHQARLDSELADLQIAQLEFDNTKKLSDKNAVSRDEVQLLNAKLAKAKARAQLARAELSFANVRAPFDGMVDRLPRQLGSFVLKGESLTELYDNRMVRAYFNVPEKHYLEYMARQHEEDPPIELILADHSKFPHAGKIEAIEAKFNAETGDIAFRAGFPNPEGLLRHGQAGTVVIRRTLKNAIVIPQRATLQVLNKSYIYIVDKDGVARRREVVIENELNDQCVVKTGVGAGDKVVTDGVGLVHDGEKVEN